MPNFHDDVIVYSFSDVMASKEVRNKIYDRFIPLPRITMINSFSLHSKHHDLQNANQGEKT